MTPPKHFKIGHDSVGEIYHLAMKGIQMEVAGDAADFRVEFCAPHHQMALDFFDDLKIPHEPPLNRSENDRKRILKTRKAIGHLFDGIKSGLPPVIQQRKTQILSMSKNAKWVFPLPALLTTDPKLLIWQRNEEYQPERNSSVSLIEQLAGLAIDNGTIPVIIGHKREIEGAINLGEFWNHDFFKTGHNLAKQLWFQHKLFEDCGFKASVGMKSGILDGAAMFFGHKTIFFTRNESDKSRMSLVAEAVPTLIRLDAKFDDNTGNLCEPELRKLESLIWPP